MLWRRSKIDVESKSNLFKNHFSEDTLLITANFNENLDHVEIISADATAPLDIVPITLHVDNQAAATNTNPLGSVKRRLGKLPQLVKRQRRRRKTTEPEVSTYKPTPTRQVRIHVKARISQVNKLDEILVGQDTLSHDFTIDEEEGFHVSQKFYDKLISLSQIYLRRKEPLQTYVSHDIPLEFHRIEPRIRIPDETETGATYFAVKYPLDHTHRTQMPKPALFETDEGLEAECVIHMAVTVKETENYVQNGVCTVPFRTTKMACDNLIARTKALAFYSAAMMPHAIICKMSEIFHSFKLESQDIAMTTWPTAFKLPLNDKVDKSFLELVNKGMYKITPTPPTQESPTSTSSTRPTPSTSSTRRSPAPSKPARTPFKPTTSTKRPPSPMTTPPESSSRRPQTYKEHRMAKSKKDRHRPY